MIVFLSLLLRVVISPFKTKARLEAEVILLRHQLNLVRRRIPSKPKLTSPTDCPSSGSIAYFLQRWML